MLKWLCSVEDHHLMPLFVPLHLKERKSLKKKRIQDKAGDMEKDSKDGAFFPVSVFYWPMVIFLWLWCACMCVFVRSCVHACVQHIPHAADVTFLPVKATTRELHTIMYVTHWSYRKCALPFTILLLFPIKSTKGNVIQSRAAGLEFSPHIQWIS